jgi:hypothetical protein
VSIVDRPIHAGADSSTFIGDATIAVLPLQVIAVTGALFPGPVSVENDADPEVSHQPFLVVTVEASGPVKDIVRRRREWHAKAEPFLVGLDVRLSIIPR